jgi:hypothetical protein
MRLDGQRQRNALTAAERALAALAAGDAERAKLQAAKAAELDQIGAFADLPGAVAAAEADLATTGAVGDGARTLLRAAVPPGPLGALVDALDP